MRIYNSILDLIGGTPLVRLDRLARNSGINSVNILGKIEFRNPGGSHKDRMALQAIEDAEKQGALKPKMTVVEGSSGNLATGLAMVCAVKGYKCIISMGPKASEERKDMVRALGAELIIREGVGYTTQASEVVENSRKRTREIAHERNGFFVDQFYNPSNIKVHQETTAKEILEDTEGKIDAFVTTIGSGGTFCGVSKVLKAYNPNIKVIALQVPDSIIPGIGHIFSEKKWPPFVDLTLVDGYVDVTEDEAKIGVKRLAKEEGIFGGFSSGANIMGTLKVAKNMKAGQIVVTMIYDTGLKYVSTGLFH